MAEPSLKEEIEKAVRNVEQAEATRKTAEPLLTGSPSSPEQVRFYVTKLAIWVWALYLYALAMFIIFGGGHATSDKISNLFEILKVGILPIVTFAIGHYFGTREKSGG